MGEQKGKMTPLRKSLSRQEWVALHTALLEEERKAEVQAAQAQVKHNLHLPAGFLRYELFTS